MTDWLTKNWEIVVLAVGILINVANAVSRHWSNHAGVKKWALFIAELLSFVPSKDRPGILKPPLKVK